MAFRDTREVRGDRVVFANGTEVRFSGEVSVVGRQWLPSAGRARIERTPAELELPQELQRSFDEHEILEQETFHLELTGIPPGDAVDVAPAGDVPAGFERVILYRDESGGLSWHLPDTEPLETRSLRTTSQQRFRIPLRTEAARAAVANHRARLGERSLISHLGRKVFKSLLLPIAARILGDPLRELVEWWEKRSCAEMLRTLTPDNIGAPPQPFTEWDRLANRRSLLVIHGIFSSTNGMLSRLAPKHMAELEAIYEKRVVAFDHFTASRSPEQNARWLIERLAGVAEERQLQFDILCHSRGGIVARTLRERVAELGANGRVSFHRIFFAATPNQGSALANADRIVDMLDVFTNLAATFTGGSVAVTMEVVLAVLKLIAYSGITEVPGIAAMAPGPNGYIGGTLNARTIARADEYRSVAANYEPDPLRDSAFFTVADSVIDRVFGRDTANDLVVPTEGVYTGLGKERITIPSYVHPTDVWHTELFAQQRTIDDMLEHFRNLAVPRAIEMGERTRAYEELSFDNDDLLGELEQATTRRARLDLPETPAAMPDTAALPATTVEREPRIGFRESVHPGDEHDLVVSLNLKTAQSANVVAAEIARGQTSVDITVQLFAPGFIVTPSDVQTITVGRSFDANREKVTFRLTAKPIAQKTKREITADFSVAGISIGGVSHTTWVVLPGQGPDDRTPAIQPSFNVSAAERSNADLKIIASDTNGDGKTFALRVTSNIPGFIVESLAVDDLQADASGTTSFVGTTIGKVFQQRPRPGVIPAADFPAAMEAWNKKLIDKLAELGTQIWEWLPEKFRELYFRLHDKCVPPRSIHVMSDDMLFPWELVIPWRNIDGRRDMLAPLGTAHVMGRWRPGLFIKPEPQRYPVKKIAIVNPTYAGQKALPRSKVEAATLHTTFGAVAELVTPCDLDTVTKKVLDASDIQLLHFTGHANFEKVNANQSFLELDNDEQLTAAGLGVGKFTAGAPIVILNACSVGDSGMVASRAGGFAERCLATGCSAVLAAYWPVTDGAAHDFSIAFYDKLRRGRTFGEALQELRLERQHDPTYQAYTFFGDPLAGIVF